MKQRPEIIATTTIGIHNQMVERNALSTQIEITTTTTRLRVPGSEPLPKMH